MDDNTKNSQLKKNDLPDLESVKKKKKYESPSIETEELTTYGAACNSTRRGGRKASTGEVPPCNPARLTS